jgi:hypothetical protein
MASGRDWRHRLALGVARALGATDGFLIPYRYASSVQSQPSYGALDPHFIRAEPTMRAVLATAAQYADVFLAMRGGPPQPRFEQDWFPRLDAITAYTMVRARRPTRIVEIGSGHSTRFLARAIADGQLGTHLTAIDPAPRATLNGLAVEWLKATLQTVGAAPFAHLGEGDILFIDSSHILMPGSDVDVLLNDILPLLPAGVLVHIHDVFLPDAYPQGWDWRGYNEQNAVAPLVSSGAWQVLWSSHWVATRMATEIAGHRLDRVLLPVSAVESSLWLQKR